jgi:hypothetical protein
LVGDAVKVTEVPAQTWFSDGSIETLTGSNGLTVKVTVPEVAGLPDLQARLEVMITYTWSPSAGIQE